MPRKPPKDDWSGWFNRLLVAHAEILRLSHLLRRNVVRLRERIYDFAKAYYMCQERFHNEFLAEARSRGMKLTEWSDMLVQPIEALAEPWHKIKEAIDAGMTRREFARQHSAAWLLEHAAGKRSPRERTPGKPAAKCVIPPEPESGLSPENIAARWRARALSLQSRLEQAEGEIRRLKTIIRDMRRNQALVIAQNRKLWRSIKD